MAKALGGSEHEMVVAAGPASAQQAFARALQQAVTASPHAETLLAIASHLAAQNIPLDLVTADVMTSEERQAATEALAIAGLATASHGTTFPAIDVAPAVQAQMRQQLAGSPKEATYAALATRLVADAYPHGDTDPADARQWPACQRLEGHVRAVLEFAPDDGDGAAATSRLLHQVSQYLFARGKFQDAEPVMRRAGAIAELLHGPDHPRIGQDRTDLAILLYEMGRVEEALPHIRRAMAIDEAAFGPEHPLVAERYNILATLLETLGRPAEADPFIRHAVLSAEKALGPDHPDTRLYQDNYNKIISAMDAIARRDDAVEAGLLPATPERLARPDIPPPLQPRPKTSLLDRFRRRR